MMCFHSNFQIIFNCTSSMEVTNLAPYSLIWTMLPSPFKGIKNLPIHPVNDGDEKDDDDGENQRMQDSSVERTCSFIDRSPIN